MPLNALVWPLLVGALWTSDGLLPHRLQAAPSSPAAPVARISYVLAARESAASIAAATLLAGTAAALDCSSSRSACGAAIEQGSMSRVCL
jgi:hypothetical protein